MYHHLTFRWYDFGFDRRTVVCLDSETSHLAQGEVQPTSHHRQKNIKTNGESLIKYKNATSPCTKFQAMPTTKASKDAHDANEKRTSIIIIIITKT